MNKALIEVMDRLIYSGLSLEEARKLLVHFLAEHQTFREEYNRERKDKAH